MALNRSKDGLAPVSILTSGAGPARGRFRWLRVLAALYGQPISAFGTTVVLFFIMVAILGPWFTPYAATEQISTEARQPPQPSISSGPIGWGGMFLAG